MPRRQEVFVDERGVGLRLTWHPERELVVLSVWHDRLCTASFRFPVEELPRLGGFLTAVFGDWAGDVLAARPERPNGNGNGHDDGLTWEPRAAAGGDPGGGALPPDVDGGRPPFGPFRPGSTGN
jgi:hypothetical protein